MAINLEEFAKTLLYSGPRTPDEVVEDMAALGEFDTHHEGKESLWGTLLVLAIVITIGAGLVALLAEGPARGGGFLALLVGIVVSAIVWARKSHHSGFNIVDRRYQLVANLMPLLESDMAPDAEIDLSVDFRPASDDSKFERAGKVGRWDVKYYRDPWLTVSGRFVDGTAFSIGVMHALQKRSCTKRSASGKTKYKTKQKQKSTVTVRLIARPSKYPRLPAVTGDAAGAVQLPRRAALQDLRVDGHRMAMKASLPGMWGESDTGAAPDPDSGSHTIAMMLVSMYHVLNLARDIDDRENAA